jgi:hypothetical protein
MKLLFTLLLCAMICTAGAQEKLIRGRLTDDSGAPMPGVNIVIKGTDIGTTTDADGNYTITAPIGSTLVFSFIGMTTKEILVKGDGAKKARPKAPTHAAPAPNKNILPVPAHFPVDSVPPKVPGVAVLNAETPRYSGTAPNAADIRAIKRIGNQYYLRRYPSGESAAFDVQFTTSIGIEKITQLPALQNDFAQGRPQGGKLEWRGPDQQEIFSWGPLLRTLEFDGEIYPFDQHGKLTPAGTGNGVAAVAYPSLTLFRTGVANTNELKLLRRTRRDGQLQFVAETQNRHGVIPGTSYNRYNFLLSARKIQLHDNLSIGSSVNYNQSRGQLLPRGANTASIVGSILRTPVSFDNGNGLNSKAAYENPNAYFLSDGSMRSHAPGLIDNPYALVSALPDEENLRRMIGSADLNYSHGHFSLIGSLTYDHQINESTFGIPIYFSGYPEGRITHRQDRQTAINSGITTGYSFIMNRSNLKMNLTFQNQHLERDLDRKDGFRFQPDEHLSYEAGDSSVNRVRSIVRNVQEILFNGVFNYHGILNFKFSNRAYFSTTAESGAYRNFFPGAGLRIDLSDIIQINPRISIFSSASRNIQEGSLLYSDWAYASTHMSAASYSSHYEASELLFPDGLSPETEQKFESGLDFQHRNIDFSMTYYNNVTKDFIIPVHNGLEFEMRNAATIRNEGFQIKAGYERNYWSEVNYGISVIWEKYNNQVLDLTGSEDFLPIAGFNGIQTVLAEGKPVGTIYGSTWKRNEAGQKIIGADGFPLVDLQPRAIGNPLPDWKLAWNGFVSAYGLKLSFAFEYRHGGQIYNGTQAALDYTGRSIKSGTERSITNYVFEGVTEAGNVNTTPVTFSDPGRPIEENRWVRYGFSGVGEEYIEDASMLRLTDLSLSYSILRRNRSINEIRVALIGQNLLLVTPYSGVDPASKLFNYANGSGLDLFNQPSTRSYSLQITIKL